MEPLGRNDLDGALAVARAELEETGELSPETGETLYMLQDDPTELLAAYRALYAELGITYPED
jgi:hypothetical protein